MEEDIHEIKQSLQRLEEKLDKFSEITHTNVADIKWVKGFIKVTVSILIAAISGLLSLLLPTIK